MFSKESSAMRYFDGQQVANARTAKRLWSLAFCAAVIASAPAGAAVTGAGQDSLPAVYADFASAYAGIGIPRFGPDYAENFRNIPSLDGIAKQFALFEKTRARLQSIARSGLATEAGYQYDALLYEIDLNLERLNLEKAYRQVTVDAPPAEGGLYRVADGKRWYALYVRKTASKEIAPEDLFRFGEAELDRISAEIRTIQAALGYAGKDREFYRHLNDASFFSASAEDVQSRFLALREVIQKLLPETFPTVNTPPLAIKANPNPGKDSPPGYYTEETFFYTFFNHRFPARSSEWLFLHEAIPGHHYQQTYPADALPAAGLFYYPAYLEGWGAYCEDLGRDLGLYVNPYLALGKWEWDLVRSARVVLDVGIHYKGWSRKQALAYWRARVPGQDEIAERELDRITRWPAQAISYKVGEKAFLDLRREFQKRHPGSTGAREFHALVLKRGALPLSVLERVVHDASH